MARTKKAKNGATIVKKYANRRLYDTGQSRYVTLEDLCTMVKEGHDFVVQDAKSGEDITHSVLTQIIAEQEGKGPTLLPTGFLKKLIGFYGESVQNVVPNYLNHSLEFFTQNQEQFQNQMSESLENVNMFKPTSSFEEIGRQNMAMFENAMKMFTPFAGGFYRANDDQEERKKDIQKQMEELQKELDEMKS